MTHGSVTKTKTTKKIRMEDKTMITRERRAMTTDSSIQRFIHDDDAAEALVDVFYQELLSDFGDCRRILKLYAGGSEETRTLIDGIFVSLCGMSLYALISKTEDALDRESEDESMTFYHMSQLTPPELPDSVFDWLADMVLADPGTLQACQRAASRR